MKNHLILFVLVLMTVSAGILNGQYQTAIISPDDKALLLESPGGTLGEGPLSTFECNYNMTTYTAVIGMIPEDVNKPHRTNSLEFRSPLDGRLNFFIDPVNVLADDLKMTIVNTGEVGVGVVNPDAQLHVNSDLDDVVLMEREGGMLGEGPLARFRSEYNASTYDAVVGMIPNDNNKPHRNNSIELRSPLNGRFNFFVNPTNVNPDDLKMTIVNTGEVGVGVVNPDAQLHVNSDLDDVVLMEREGGMLGEGPLARFRSEYNASTYDAVVGMIPNDNNKPHRNNSIELRSPLNGRFNFFVNPTNVNPDDLKMTIVNTGEVGVGVVNPDAQLHVNSDLDDVVLMERDGGLLGEGPLARFRSDYNATTYNAVVGMIPNDNNKPHRNNSIELRSPLNGRFNFFVNPTNVNPADLKMTIIDNGNVGIGLTAPNFLLHVNGTAGKPGGGSWTVASDKRLKKNITPFNDGLALVEQIEPVRFQYKDDSGMDSNKQWIGILAQDMQTIAPYSVSTFTAEDGNDYLAFDPSSMDFILVNAIKELQTKVNDLESQLEEKNIIIQDTKLLSDRIDALESMLIQNQ